MPGYKSKKYMKQGTGKEYPLVRLFLISFFGMLLFFTVIINMFAKPVDVTIGDYKQETEVEEEAPNVDGRLMAIQDEDAGRSFSDLMKTADDANRAFDREPEYQQKTDSVAEALLANDTEKMYKVYIGAYTSAEQAKVAKDIIMETDSTLNPIVKCIGSNNYTLQVGIFRSKDGAEAVKRAAQQNHLPQVRVVVE